MRIRLLFSLIACFAVLAASPCQITTPKGSQSDQTNIKLAKLDLLIKLVPLGLTKSQYPDLLLGLEKARELERATLKQEDADLAVMDPTISTVIQNAIEKGVYPPRDVQNDVAKQLNAIRTRRLLTSAKMANTVYDAIKAGLNSGQIKAMAGSFDDSFVQSGAKDGTLTPEVKIMFYINQVLLDPLAYDLLVEMSKHAS
jgi:hypothetical protein